MKVCLLGICGTFMAGIALICRDMGYQVVGMDENVYPPMDGLLAEAGIEVINGYAENDLPTADIYLVGNAMSRGIPAVELLLREKRPYMSAPQWLGDNVLRQRKVIAVSGTHGKTTTTALLTKMLTEEGKDVGYLIAGAAKDFPLPARLGSDEFVIEADEYDTVFFDKRSKFVHYRPDILLINNLEYDHADIFPDMQAIETQFCHLLRSLPATTEVIYPSGNESILKCISKEKHSRYHQILGVFSKADELPDVTMAISAADAKQAIDNASAWAAISDGSSQVNILSYDSKDIKASPESPQDNLQLAWHWPGRHNAMNLLFATAAAKLAGVSADAIGKAASNFQGVARRLEKVGEVQGAEVISDFAHHPTAIKETIAALKTSDKHSQHKLLAVVQLASNSMRLGTHGTKLLEATMDADEVFWFAPRDLEWQQDLLDKYTTPTRNIYTNSADLAKDLLVHASDKSVILIMSNSSLAGLPEKLGI